MNTDQHISNLNLWDLEVTSIRLFQSTDKGPPTFDLEVAVTIRPHTVAPDSQKENGWFRFYECVEFGAAIDVRMWAMVGPELSEGRDVPSEVDAAFTRYTLNLRPPGGSLEVVARSFDYEGPDIRTISLETSRES
jgi:hypothetical protein